MVLSKTFHVSSCHHEIEPMLSPAITESSIVRLVDTFYARVRDDAVLGPVFEAKLAGRWHEHMPRMYAFWTKILLGTGEFQGNVYGKHMALSGIATEHFVHWLTLFRITAIDVFGTEAATEPIEVAQRIASSLQLGFFGEIRV
jgi:hemoglobin